MKKINTKQDLIDELKGRRIVMCTKDTPFDLSTADDTMTIVHEEVYHCIDGSTKCPNCGWTY